MGIVASCCARILPFAAQNAGSDRGDTTSQLRNAEEGHGGHRSNNGSYFGTHFLMGGERYDVAKPDTFLFGDMSDLEILENKPVTYPYNIRGVSHTVNVLNALVNVRRDSVKFAKLDHETETNYKIEFVLDSDVPCYVQVHYMAREFVSDRHIRFISKGNSMSTEKIYFPEGMNQLVDKFEFHPIKHNFSFQYDTGLYFPIVIEVRSVPDEEGDYPTQVQATMCSIDKSSDQSATLILKPMKQKLIADGVTYLLQEIYGIENKESVSQSIDDNNGECIICMANPRDTVILPCRHLCICNGCAETLRFRLQNCPICRSPFKALFKFTPASGDGPPGQQPRLTLVEALNGPSNTNSSNTNSLCRVKSDSDYQVDEKAKREKAAKTLTLCRHLSTDEVHTVEIELQPMSTEAPSDTSLQRNMEDEEAKFKTFVQIDFCSNSTQVSSTDLQDVDLNSVTEAKPATITEAQAVA